LGRRLGDAFEGGGFCCFVGDVFLVIHQFDSLGVALKKTTEVKKY
jgi:hypothetical protein